MAEITQISKDLLACPFCGSAEVNNTAITKQGANGFYYWVCPECVMQGPIAANSTKATKLWNSRHD